jgi:hypothetical protein
LTLLGSGRTAIIGDTMPAWALLAGTVVFCLFAISYESSRWRWPSLREWLAIAYGGLVTFALSYVAWSAEP